MYHQRVFFLPLRADTLALSASHAVWQSHGVDKCLFGHGSCQLPLEFSRVTFYFKVLRSDFDDVLHLHAHSHAGVGVRVSLEPAAELCRYWAFFLACHTECRSAPCQPPPQFGEEIPTIRQDNSAGLFFGELLPSHQDYDPGPPNTLSLWLLCCQRHVETLVS